MERVGGHIDLPSSKQIVGVVPGNPQQIGSLPIAIAVSPDGRYVVTVNGGYGSLESSYEQSVSVLDTTTGKVIESPDPRTLGRSASAECDGPPTGCPYPRLLGTAAPSVAVIGGWGGDEQLT